MFGSGSSARARAARAINFKPASARDNRGDARARARAHRRGAVKRAMVESGAAAGLIVPLEATRAARSRGKKFMEVEFHSVRRWASRGVRARRAVRVVVTRRAFAPRRASGDPASPH